MRLRSNLQVVIVAISMLTAGCGQKSALMHEVLLRDILPPRLEEFRRDVGRYPTQEEGFAALFTAPVAIQKTWRGPYTPDTGSLSKDPWMHDYVYHSPSQTPGKSYDLICLGPDGVKSADDFIVSR